MPAFLSADFETVLVKQTVIYHHKLCGYALKIVTPYAHYQQPIKTYRGVDSATHFIESLKEVSNHLQPLMERMLPTHFIKHTRYVSGATLILPTTVKGKLRNNLYTELSRGLVGNETMQT